MIINIEDNKYLERFFSHHQKYAEELKSKIYNEAEKMITNMPHKIKTVSGYKYRKKTIYEYKIKIDKYFICRAAYIIVNEEVIFFFISTTLIKAEFTKLIAAFSGVTK